MEAPGFEEHRAGRNAWALRIQDDETEQVNRDQLFADGIDTQHLRLVSSRTFRSGVVQLQYETEQKLPQSEFLETYAWTPGQVRSLQAAQDRDRVLASVLFTDIVDSTARAAEVG